MYLVVVLLMVVGICATPDTEARQTNDPLYAIQSLLADNFVVVRLFFKVDELCTNDPSSHLTTAQYHLSNQKSMDVGGVVISEDGTTLVHEPLFNERVIDRWELVDSTGKVLPAEPIGVMKTQPGLLVRPLDSKKFWTPIRFGMRLQESSTPSPLRLVQAGEFQGQWALTVSTMPAITPLNAPDDRVWLTNLSPEQKQTGSQLIGMMEETTSVGAGVVVDRDGRLLGVTTCAYVPQSTSREAVLCAELTDNDYFPIEIQQEQMSALEQWAESAVYEVRMVFRQDGGASDSLALARLMSQLRSARPLEEDERYNYGIAISPSQLWVPETLDRETAKNIETISVIVDGTDYVGTLVGCFRDFGAYLVTISEPILVPTWNVGDLQPSVYEHFYTIHFRRLFGDRFIEVQSNRITGWDRGYANTISPRLMRDLDRSALLMDDNFQILGVALERITPHGIYEDSQGFFSVLQQTISTQTIEVFSAQQLQHALDEIPDSFDQRIVVMSREQARRKVWLGVEYTRITRDVAEGLACLRATRDGTIGLVVNAVYENSPAQRAGVTVGDILLSIRPPDRDYPIQLRARGDGSTPLSFSTMDLSDILDSRGGQNFPWPSQANHVNTLLADVGVGNTIELRYWRDGDIREVALQVEQAPHDYESAARYRNDDLGLHLRDLTYEVRHALSLVPTDHGVVVSEVITGSPAAQARVRSFELITAANGTTITDVTAFEEMIDAAQEAGETMVRLTIWNRGRTRTADLDLR